MPYRFEDLEGHDLSCPSCHKVASYYQWERDLVRSNWVVEFVRCPHCQKLIDIRDRNLGEMDVGRS